MSTMLDLQPGETFRHQVTIFQQGRDSPPADLTDCEVSTINLDPAPWVIQVLWMDQAGGRFQLYIPDSETKLGKPYCQYAFQIRIHFPGSEEEGTPEGDKMFIGPIVISTGAEYLATSPIPSPNDPEFPLAAE